MFSKTNKTKKSFIGAIAMSLVLLMGSALGFLIETRVGQITRPTIDVWTNYTEAPTQMGDYYYISKASQLAYIAKNPSIFSEKNIYLVSDIDLVGHEWVPINVSGTSSNFVEFDGMGHTISNIKISDSTKDNVGLFGSCTNIKISNLKLSIVDIKGKSNVGAVIGNGGMITNIDKVEVKSGKVVATGGNVAGIAYSAMGSVTNSTNNADVVSYGANAAGIVGATCLTITNCINTGDVTGTTNVAGIIANPSISRVTKCYADCTITGQSDIGGIGGSVAMESTFQDCGFYGEIVSTNSSPGNIGAILAKSNVKNYGTSPMKIYNCYAVADMFLSADVESSVHKFGAPTEQTEFKSSYSYSAVTTPGKNYEYRKYKVDSSETELFKDMVYHANINGGYPFPKSLFAVGQFIECDTMNYLQEYDFSKTYYEIRNDGAHYYVELGQYPQTYVGDSLNTELKNWYSSTLPTRVESYTNDLGTSADWKTTYVYRYKGNDYARYESANTSASGYKFQNGTTVVNGSEYWFKIEPIKWWILNYSELQSGAAPIVLAEKGLTANVTWNKSTTSGILWAGTCNIRTWLNSEFYGNSFYGEAKDCIKQTTVLNNTSSSLVDGSGSSTNDKVWLLSYEEAEKYFTQAERKCEVTDYAIVNKVTQADAPYTSWWLRSAHSSSPYVRGCDCGGYITFYDMNDTRHAVRPALTLNI